LILDSVSIKGLRVQLEATMILKYEAGIDNHMIMKRKIYSVLSGSPEPKPGYYYMRSPIRDQILGDLEGYNFYIKMY
jgi:hypothetical protein